jgi:TonB-linked SusC/RagA family outer membrane protein
MKFAKRLLHWASLSVLVLLLSTNAFAQQQITGVLRTPTGEPMIGATVTVKGTNVSVATDENGRFTINAAPGSTLVFSSVGFQEREVVATATEMNEVLQASDASLNEVVVIGYQSVRKRDLTGATGIVRPENTQRIVQRSFPEALQGMSPGVVVRNGGAPGQEAVVNIRGLGTFSGNANPLYVIDGMISDPNTTVNPNDVETIQILKDASAAAIYGSRAGNGVIIVTTKKGREGPMRVNVTSRVSMATIPKRYEMMNADEYVATNKLAYQNAGYALQPAVANYNGQVDTDWDEELLRTGSIQDHNVTFSGGSKTSTYLISLSYFKDIGTLIKRDFERTALRINTESTRGRFKLGVNLMLSNSMRNAPIESTSAVPNFEVGNPWFDVWNNLPIIPVRDPSLAGPGNPGGWGIGSSDARTFSRNAIAIADITSVRTNFFKVLGNAYVDFRITDWLSYRFNAGAETSLDRAKTIRRDGNWYWNQSPKLSEVGENRSQYLSFLFDHTLNFTKNFGDHRINGVIGYTEQTFRNDNANASRSNLVQYGGNYLTTINSAAGGAFASGGNRQYLITAYIGRLNYNFDDRYLATFTFRTDKDSRFSPNFRRGWFPSAALAWNVGNEPFYDLNWMSDLKVRASYGVLGLANLLEYQYIGFLNQAPRAVFGSGAQAEFPGATQARLVYEDLRWEEKATFNFGVDAGFFNNQLLLTLDLFRAKSSDVLVEQPLPRFLGNLQGSPLVNAATIENKGIELELGYRPARKGNFNWNIAANVSVIRNKVLALPNLGVDAETGQPRNYIQSGNTRSQVGRSIGEFYVIKTDGIFQDQKEIDDHEAQARFAKPGDIRFVNLVDEGTDDDINDKDRQFAGSPWPKFTTGLQFNANYGAFSFNLQLYGAFGQKLYNGVRSDLDAMGYSNYRKDLNPWTETNRNTSDPRLGVGYVTGVPGDPNVDQGIVANARANTDRWIEDGSYLRLRSVEIGYTLPKALISRIRLSDVRVFIGGQNLVTFSGYSGLDPDVVGANFNLEPGVDNGNYPSSRMLTAGINVGF